MKFGCPHCHKPISLLIDGLKRERVERGEASPEAKDLIEFFRAQYLKVVDPQYQGFKTPYPVEEVRAATFFTTFHKESVRQVILWVSQDQTREGRWTGWAHQVRGLAKLKQKWMILEQKARLSGRCLSLPPGKGARPSDSELERLLLEERTRLRAAMPAASYEGMTDQQFMMADRKREIQIIGQARENVAERLGIEL